MIIFSSILFLIGIFFGIVSIWQYYKKRQQKDFILTLGCLLAAAPVLAIISIVVSLMLMLMQFPEAVSNFCKFWKG